MLLGLKLLLTEGAPGATTVSVALAGVVFVMVVPPPVEFRAFAGMLLTRMPGVVDVTLIDTVHEPGVLPVWAGTVPPVNRIVPEPAAAVTVPPHVLEVTPTTVMPVGKLSVQEALVSGNKFGLKIVTRSKEFAPGVI